MIVRTLAAAVIALMAVPADAALVTRGFRLDAASFVNFFDEPAPFSSLRIDFRLTYDDTANGIVGAPDSFTAVTDGQVNAGAFSATPAFGYFPSGPLLAMPRLIVGGVLNGTNVQLNRTNDFFFSFDANAVGATPAMLSFTTTANRVPFLAIDAVVAPAAPVLAAVPEAATWAMMICGFGAVGGTLRRRRRAGARAPA